MSEPTNKALIAGVMASSPARRNVAWNLFYPTYQPMIFHWCQRRGLRPEICEDLTQELLVKLSKELVAGKYDLSRPFRPWLKTVVSNFLKDYFEAQKVRVESPGGSEHYRMLAELPNTDAPEELSNLMAGDAISREVAAVLEIKKTTNPIHWEAFWGYHLAGQTASELAAQLELTVMNVNKILYRIKQRLEQEVGCG